MLAQLESQYTQAKLTADRDLELTRLNLKSDLESPLVRRFRQAIRKTASRCKKQRLEISDESIKAQIDAQKVVIESARAAWISKRNPSRANSRSAPASTASCRS